jgi:hypothetical protein
MEAVKHKPRTPLPWTFNKHSGYVFAQAEGQHTVVARADRSPGDTGYATHAANAYPKLVEALRACEDGSLEGLMRAKALLRELGEAA